MSGQGTNLAPLVTVPFRKIFLLELPSSPVTVSGTLGRLTNTVVGFAVDDIIAAAGEAAAGCCWKDLQ
jgi:hypothetical protein